MNREYRRKYLFDFAKEKITYKNKFYKIVFFSEEDDISRILRTVDNNISMKKRMDKILFPQSIQDMCSKKLVLNSDIQIDFLRKYYMSIFNKYIYKIEKYVELKTEFEKHLFLQEYELALNVLTEIEAEVGLSVWSISKKMLLYEKIYGLEKNKKYLDEIQTQASDNIMLNTLFELESYFAEENTSYTSFKKKIDSYNEDLQDNEIIRKYINFKFNVEREFDIEEIEIALMFDSQFFIIDMYESFVISDQMRFVEGEVDNYELKLDDFRLANLSLITKPKPITGEQLEYYSLLETYTSGNYKNYIEECNKYLERRPQDFQCIILLVKSYIFLNEEPHFDDGVYRWLYNAYMVNEYEADAIQKLFSYIKVVRGTSWEYKVIGFIARKTSMQSRKRLSFMSAINDMCISPNLMSFNCISNREAFLEIFKNVCPITYQLFLFKYGMGELSDQLSDKNRKLLFETDRYIQQGDNVNAIKTLDKINKDNNYFLERILRRQITIFENSEDYLSEVRCITNAILKNHNLQRRIDIQRSSDNIRHHLTKEIKKNLNYVVFVYLSMPSDYKKQRIAYSNYMDYNNFKSIKDVIEREEKGPALVTFLDRVCIQHLIKRDIILNPEGNRVEEIRIEILQNLIVLDSENKKKYYAEITAITKQRSIKDRIKQINQSRVFVDTENIKKENELALREDFNRYLSVKNLDEELMTYDIYSTEYISDLKKIVDDINDKIRNNATYSQKMVILKGIITTITEEFLFNEKYGLNTFLSSRIRHGYCKNQLTTIFQEYNLLSKKEKNDSSEYLINEYWDHILPENSKGSRKVKKCLSLFTADIEKKVDEIKKEWLSIRYKEENNALLDFTMCVNQLLLIDMDNIIDFNTFYDQVIDLLWQYTLNYFVVLKKKIQEDLLNYFQAELNALACSVGNIKNEDVRDAVKSISSSINLCKSQIGGKTIEFANVFEKKDVTYLDFTMDDLVDTCLEIISQLNGGMAEINLKKNISDTNLYKGENFPYFVDAVNIMINNALEHSGISDYSKLEIDIDVNKVCDEAVLEELKDEFEKKRIKVDDLGFLELSISNTLSEDIDINVLRDKVGVIFANTKNTETVKKYSQSEGGTGLYKLYKTFQYNIDAAYAIWYQIEENLFGISVFIGITNIMA